MLREILELIARFGRNSLPEEDMSSDRLKKLSELRDRGFVTFDHLVGTKRLQRLQTAYKKRVEVDLDFEFPCLAQSKIKPDLHADLIENNFLATPEELSKRDVVFSRDEVESYSQIVEKFEPSTLKILMPDQSEWYDLWLDEEILPIIEAYMGFVPQLTEAYIRRNFPAKYKVMNHAWHRDRNHNKHLLKAFVFLSDCTLKTGPHHYIAGSVKDRRLDGANYFSEDAIREVYGKGDERECISVVPAGTIVLEDTRGLHKAGVPEEGYRDLGFATFVPAVAFRKTPALYQLAQSTMTELSSRQKLYIPASNIAQ